MRSSMDRTLILELADLKADGREVVVAGWVRSRRDSKAGLSFVEMSDGSTQRTLQIVAESTLPNYESEVRQSTTGACIRVCGRLVASQGKGQAVEVQATTFELLGRVDEDYPLQKKRHSFEFLREIAHLRPRTNTIGAVLRLRNALSYAIHTFFQERHFVQVHTPVISGLDAEGAGQLFSVSAPGSGGSGTGPAPAMTTGPARADTQGFFGRPTFLTVSGQLQAEACALALSNVYVFGPTFRAENSNTSRHLAEFWMVEPEMAFCDLGGDAALAVDFLKAILRSALERCPEEMAFFAEHIDPQAITRIEQILAADFERMTYTEAVELLRKSGRSFEFPVEWGRDLQSEHERYLAEDYVGRPVIVTDYPADLKAFYMKLNDDGRTVRAMDLLVPRIGEIIGGSEREDRLDVLTDRMQNRGMDTQALQWYLDLRRFGGAPHSGFGLGFERLIQYVSGVENIREAIPFPRTPNHASF